MKTILVIIGLTFVCLIGFAAVSKITDMETATSTLVSSSSTIVATISGQVSKPGTYTVSVSSTLIDLITSAGGITTDADVLAYNASLALESKGSYYIAPLHDNSSTCTNVLISKCNLNSADADTLHSVAGFSKTTAAAVVSYRDSTTFTSLEQVKEVSGVGQATYITVRDHLTLRDE